MDPSPATEPPLAIALQWVPGFVQKLLRDLPAIRDLRMRSLALGERLQPLSADDIVAVARHLYERLNGGEELARELLLCFQDAEAFELRLGADRMRKLAVAAKIAGQDVAALLLLPMEDGAVKVTKHGTHKDLRDITLGERKALARSHNREVLLKLLEDEHPEVQNMLLSNAKVTVREVMAVAARRPAKHHVLRNLARHPRWRHNFEVQRALAKNPDTPLDVSGRIITTMGRRDLEEIVADERIASELRKLAQTRVEALGGEAVYILEE